MFQRWLKIEGGFSSLTIGPRRSGKTTLLRALFPEVPYCTLDDLDILDWAKRDPKGLVQHLGERAIIDEIQRHPPLTIAVKYAIDNLGARFYMTGSSSLGLLDSAGETLAGRARFYSLPPMCWGEERGQPTHSIFSDRLPYPKIKEGLRELETVTRYGLFPEVVREPTPEGKAEILTLYRNSYFTRDLMQLSNIQNIHGLLNIFHNLAVSIGSHLEISNFAREAQLSFHTTKKYINSLLQSQLIFELPGYQYGPAKRFIKAKKTYFCDNGIISSFGVEISEGQRVENFVISELEKRRKLGLIKTERFFYYKSAAGREIDLVFESEGTVYAIEIKASKSPSRRDIKNLKGFGQRLTKPCKLFLFYLGEEYLTVDGVSFLPIAAIRSGA